MHCTILFNPGLGDHILMSGAVRCIARSYDTVDLTCLNFEKEVRRLYIDETKIRVCRIIPNKKAVGAYYDRFGQRLIKKHRNDPNVDVRAFFFRNWHKWPELIRNVGMPASFNWCQLFYYTIGVPWRERYDSFKIERNLDKELELAKTLKLPNKYIFAANVCSKFRCDLKINSDLPVITPESYPGDIKQTSIFDWCGVIEGAEEVHTIDTSWFHLIRSMQLSKPKYFHTIRPVPASNYFNDELDPGWVIV